MVAIMEVSKTGDGLENYYRSKIEELELVVRDKTQNLRRLQAQRNDLNSKGMRPTHGVHVPDDEADNMLLM